MMIDGLKESRPLVDNSREIIMRLDDAIKRREIVMRLGDAIAEQRAKIHQENAAVAGALTVAQKDRMNNILKKKQEARKRK